MNTQLKHSQGGFTLVELMVAAVLGLLISGAVGALFVQGSRSHAQDDRYVRMIENARFAIDSIARDLRMISFWGEMLDPGAITSTLVAGEDCGLGLFDGADAVLTNNPHATPAVSQFDIGSGTCPALTGTVAANTNQIAIKHTSGVSQTAGQENNTVYVRSNGISGSFVQFISGTTPAPTGAFVDWAYTPSLYYIQDGGATPFLCRLRVANLAFAATTTDECFAEGIEQIYLQFGIDTDGDSVANQYKSNPTTPEMSAAVTARIYVLARTTTEDPLLTNAKSYVLGDLTIAAVNDNFYRRVFSTTIQLRNPANLNALN